jgi:hypothetical protein
MAANLETSALFAFLAGGIIFFNSRMDDPQPPSSAAAMCSASFHFHSTNFTKASSTLL